LAQSRLSLFQQFVCYHPPQGGGESAVLPASANAQHEFGIVVWGVDAPSKDLRETAVRGYDASNARVIEIRTKTVLQDDTHASVSIGAMMPVRM
jgi:hypothetical protein